ncbi:MAG: aldolase, partial [Verrucomicrobiae bacterium]|nr:aldolase [Verrucomicrobiae bacterium]
MKDFRLKRLFNPKSGRCFDVAVDHGFFNEPGFLKGIESMPKTIETLVAAGPDAIQLTIGQARHLQSVAGRFKPSLVLRVDTANIYGKQLPDSRFSAMIEEAALQAVQLDAACVCVNLFQIPGAPDVTDQCVDNILRLKVETDRYGMPMMVEPLVFAPNESAGGYMVDGDAVKIVHLVRQAVELGADIIKA